MKSSPGRVAHRVNRRGIGDACVNGAAVRSLCGGLFHYQDRSRRAPRVRGVRSALQATAADMILGAGPPSRAFRREVFRHESGIPARVGRRRRRTRAGMLASHRKAGLAAPPDLMESQVRPVAYDHGHWEAQDASALDPGEELPILRRRRVRALLRPGRSQRLRQVQSALRPSTGEGHRPHGHPHRRRSARRIRAAAPGHRRRRPDRARRRLLRRRAHARAPHRPPRPGPPALTTRILRISPSSRRSTTACTPKPWTFLRTGCGRRPGGPGSSRRRTRRPSSTGSSPRSSSCATGIPGPASP